jgi:hypothetical protein
MVLCQAWRIIILRVTPQYFAQNNTITGPIGSQYYLILVSLTNKIGYPHTAGKTHENLNSYSPFHRQTISF